MGLNFRKSQKIGALKLTAGKKSVGVSVGNKLFGVSVNSKGRKTARVSLPGTGLSYTWNLSGKKKRK